jgi:4-hydroxybenzoate polyprenyltransferase
MILAIVQSLRIRQWTKNLLVFAGLIFSQNLLETDLLIKAFFGFVLFCLVSSSGYIFNDIGDIEKDRLHPEKCKRPLASGRLSIRVALCVVLLLLAGGLFFSFWVHQGFGWIVLGYISLSLVYTRVLKKIPILDVIVIASGFVLRAIAGAVIIDVSISSWLLLCTIFLALFLALSKRRNELTMLGDDATHHRKILVAYSPVLIDQMVSVVTASTVIAYALYTTSTETVAKFGTRNLVFTLPFVLYGIFRYLYLVHQENMGGSPEQILLKDKSMIINILLYLLTVAVFLYFK